MNNNNIIIIETLIVIIILTKTNISNLVGIKINTI